MPDERKAFKTECRSCGEPMWMVPTWKKDGSPGWAPMNVDEEDPNTPPLEFVRELAHHRSCPEAAKWRNGRRGE